ncbi:hypothetical protein OROHE_001994 [Orobanche hederae]
MGTYRLWGDHIEWRFGPTFVAVRSLRGILLPLFHFFDTNNVLYTFFYRYEDLHLELNDVFPLLETSGWTFDSVSLLNRNNLQQIFRGRFLNEIILD